MLAERLGMPLPRTAYMYMYFLSRVMLMPPGAVGSSRTRANPRSVSKGFSSTSVLGGMVAPAPLPSVTSPPRPSSNLARNRANCDADARSASVLLEGLVAPAPLPSSSSSNFARNRAILDTSSVVPSISLPSMENLNFSCDDARSGSLISSGSLCFPGPTSQ